MSKKGIITLVVIVVVLLLGWWWYSAQSEIPVEGENMENTEQAAQASAPKSPTGNSNTTPRSSAGTSAGTEMEKSSDEVATCASGDVNADGSINAIDRQIVENLSSGRTSLGQYPCTDLNGNGVFDPSDKDILVKAIVKAI